ncbi:hypothetical protein X975_15113, partial [Stegodyphus mimosarum]
MHASHISTMNYPERLAFCLDVCHQQTSGPMGTAVARLFNRRWPLKWLRQNLQLFSRHQVLLLLPL